MEKVKVEDAIGMVLAHDLTKIVPGVFKGAAFKKGYIIKEEDIPELKNMGKNHLWVIQLTAEQVHENEAARRVAIAAASSEMVISEPLEGKANIQAAYRGLLKINRATLYQVNQKGNIALVSLHDNTVVQARQTVAAAKIIPLTVEREEVEQIEQICKQNSPVIDIKPLFRLKTGVIVTGSEVYYGRIKDRFGAVLKEKIAHYEGDFFDLQFAPDDSDFIYGLIQGFIEKGVEIILVSGGMAVDADDVTPQAIEKSSSEVVSYGVPLLPGAMCMIAYRQQVAIVGVPACAMFNRTTVLDLIFPRLLAKEKLTRDDLISFAHGGLCLQCEECHYPNCSFGK
jgi:molybdopterin biosynthesis enzyme MoaB